jgi:hypothetical protein
MIDRYFACTDCKIYLNAGDRWAYWTLEDNRVVRKGAPISVKTILFAQEYWAPEEGHDSDWLYSEVFPSVRSFMEEHESHQLLFGDQNDFLFGAGEDYYKDHFNWMQVGFAPSPSIRFLVEQLDLKTWDEVCNYLRDRPAAWMHPDMRDAAKKEV